jgi:amino-acid N-acetyltransferase
MFAVDRARPADMEHVAQLIESAGLPLDGFGEVPTAVFVVRTDDGLVGTAALETHGEYGLLRSVAVTDAHRGAGIGSALVAAAESDAAANGLGGPYLLTETAAAFFIGRGYSVIPRDGGPEPIMASIEWATACSESAVPMVRVVG